MMLAMIGQGRRQGRWSRWCSSNGRCSPAPSAAAALVEKGKEYVEAAICLAWARTRILFGHLLPNCLPPLIVIAHAAGRERHLGGSDPELPRHRRCRSPSRRSGCSSPTATKCCMSGQYWISVYPGLLLCCYLVFSINIVGDRLREVLNPRLQAVRRP